jgi:hypothetical protein
MELNWGQIILQLGISGAIVYVVYRIAIKGMETQREAERERTKAFAEAEKERTQAIREGFAADIAAHDALAKVVGKLSSQFSRIEGRIDTFFELTPVREQLAAREPKVIIDPAMDDDEPTPVDRPPERPLERRQTPVKGVPTQYGPFVRPKTSG